MDQKSVNADNTKDTILDFENVRLQLFLQIVIWVFSSSWTDQKNGNQFQKIPNFYLTSSTDWCIFTNIIKIFTIQMKITWRSGADEVFELSMLDHYNLINLFL